MIFQPMVGVKPPTSVRATVVARAPKIVTIAARLTLLQLRRCDGPAVKLAASQNR